MREIQRVIPFIDRILCRTRRTERAAAKAYSLYVEPSESRSNEVMRRILVGVVQNKSL